MAQGKLTHIDKKQFEQLCRMFCTKSEIAAVFGIDPDTVTAWCQRTYGMNFKEVYAIYGTGQGKVALRRKQWERVNAGSDTMLIWYGKNYLGQTDKVEDISKPKEMKITIAKQSVPDEIKNAGIEDDGFDEDEWLEDEELQEDIFDEWESEWED